MAPAKDRKQIREIRPHGAPFGVKRVHGVAGEGTEMRLASRRRDGIASETKTRLAAYDLLDARPVSTS